MPYLIPYEQASRIEDIPDPIIGDAYSTALGYGGNIEGAPAWATAETLVGLKALGLEPEILEERPTLPVFHGLMRFIETIHYEEVLSCKAYALFDKEVKGVCYIGCNCEEDLWQLHASVIKDFFFYYSQNEMRPYIWMAVVNEECANFLYHLYQDDANLLAWLQNIGFDPLSEEEQKDVDE